MRHGRHLGIAGTALVALLALPAAGLAQEQAGQGAKHKHYTLVDIGTFGGPHSQVNFNSRVINSSGTVAGGASTAVPDPICTFDVPICFYFHALQWQKGVVTDLGTLPGGNNSFAVAISSRGSLAGASENGLIDPVLGPEVVATLWKDGQIVDLGTLGGILSLGFDINDRDQIVGYALNAIPDPFLGGTELRAFLWQDGRMQDLGTLGDGPDAIAQFINERGQVAGISFTSSVPNPESGIPTIDPFLWENGHMTDLGSLGGVGINTAVTGLNRRGQVTGNSDVTRDGSITHAFLWDGSLHDLGTLGGDFSFTNWIDDSGEAVGGATTQDNATLRATRWKNGHATNLGSLYGDICSIAFGSNSAGQIVGNSIPCDVDGPSRPFLWENGGPMVDMNSLIPPGSGLILREGVFINDAGEIAGVADLENGDQHAFLLIPGEGNAADLDSGTTESDAVQLRPDFSSVQAARARLTPEKLTALRERFSHRQRGPGSLSPKQAD